MNVTGMLIQMQRQPSYLKGQWKHERNMETDTDKSEFAEESMKYKGLIFLHRGAGRHNFTGEGGQLRLSLGEDFSPPVLGIAEELIVGFINSCL